MKTYDHEPTLSELADQLQKEYAYIPDFMPQMNIPIVGAIIKKIMKKSLVDNFVNFLLT